MVQPDYLVKLTILVFFVSFVACKHSKNLNTDEQQLASLIMQEGKELEELQQNTELSDINSSGKDHLRLQEDRSTDPGKPPLVLDIPRSRGKIKPVKYSELGKSVRYILLRHPGDSACFKNGAKVLFSKNNIITSSLKGISRFDLNGQFLEMICEDGQKAILDKNTSSSSFGDIINQYEGSEGELSIIGDKIFYQYVDRPNKKAWLMEYDASPGNLSLIIPSSIENRMMRGKGNRIANLPSGRRNNIFLLDEEHWATKYRKMQSSGSGFFMTVHTLNGDTICKLKDNDPVINFTSTVYRGVDNGDNYRLNGQVFIRQNFNDTIYRVEAPNHLVPVYVFELGEKGIQSSKEGVTPGYSLEDKFVYNSVFETNKFLFFVYTQDYVCPNTGKNGTLKYNCFVLNKTTGEMYHAYVDEKPYMPKGKMTWPSSPKKNIINDLDFGPAQWPSTQTEDGKIYFSFTGKEIKEHVMENQNNLNKTNRDKLEAIAQNCLDTDVIVMIIE